MSEDLSQTKGGKARKVIVMPTTTCGYHAHCLDFPDRCHSCARNMNMIHYYIQEGSDEAAAYLEELKRREEPEEELE